MACCESRVGPLPAPSTPAIPFSNGRGRVTTDELAELNGFRGVKVRPMIRGIRRGQRRFGPSLFEEMHEFAAAGRASVRKALDPPRAAINYEPMLRTTTDTGLRLGEYCAAAC